MEDKGNRFWANSRRTESSGHELQISFALGKHRASSSGSCPSNYYGNSDLYPKTSHKAVR
jgi:hypothetical protein